MKAMLTVRPYRGAYWIGWLLIPVAALLIALYQPSGASLHVFAPLALFALLYLLSPLLLARFGWFRYIYFPLQVGLVVVLARLGLDGTSLLYFPICLQAVHAFPRLPAVITMLVCLLLLSVSLFARLPAWEALALVLMFLSSGWFMVSYDFLYTRTTSDQGQSRLLLDDLQQAHRRLQEYAARAEELAAARERNRLVRDLHDSVSQTVFSIRLTAQAAHLLLDAEPERAGSELDRLQELTAGALSRLRYLLAELNPR